MTHFREIGARRKTREFGAAAATTPIITGGGEVRAVSSLPLHQIGQQQAEETNKENDGLVRSLQYQSWVYTTLWCMYTS